MPRRARARHENSNSQCRLCNDGATNTWVHSSAIYKVTILVDLEWSSLFRYASKSGDCKSEAINDYINASFADLYPSNAGLLCAASQSGCRC